MNGLDLFSGIGGCAEGLAPWVRVRAYCERDDIRRRILLSRMYRREIDLAPIWTDVASLKGAMLPPIDIITGGFPCTDISLAGSKVGLAGKRSQLFWHIVRLAYETEAPFVFIENVWPAVRKHVPTIRNAFENLGYKCRDGHLAAGDLGARHKRERWFLLAHSRRLTQELRPSKKRHKDLLNLEALGDGPATNADSERVEIGRPSVGHEAQLAKRFELLEGYDWDEYAAFLLGVDSGLPYRGHRIGGLGDTCPPIQYQGAFMRLAGLAKPNTHSSQEQREGE